MQKFLGFASYYHRFIQDFAAVAKPLHSLMEQNTHFEGTAECQHAFEELRCRLTTVPVLAYPDYTKPFVLDTDASDVGIGAVLVQHDEDGHERVVASASRTLSKAKRRYCVTRRELLAVVVFMQHFWPYLLGQEFVLHTDHGSLTWLQSFKELEGQLARWLEKLQEFKIFNCAPQGEEPPKCRCTFQTALQTVWERGKTEHHPNLHGIKRGLGQYPRTRSLAREVRTSRGRP